MEKKKRKKLRRLCTDQRQAGNVTALGMDKSKHYVRNGFFLSQLYINDASSIPVGVNYKTKFFKFKKLIVFRTLPLSVFLKA